jgi:hypothetical protein
MTRGQRRDEDRATRVLVRARRFDGVRADFRSPKPCTIPKASSANEQRPTGRPTGPQHRSSPRRRRLPQPYVGHCADIDSRPLLGEAPWRAQALHQRRRGTQFVARCRDPEGRQSPPAPTPADGPPNAPPTARKPESRPCLAQPLLRPGHLRPMRRSLVALQARRDLHPGRLPLGTFEDRVQHGVLRPR